MASPDLFPSKERQTSRGYAGSPHLHQEISHLLGDPESDDEDLPPYPGLSSRDGTIEFCFGPAPVEGRRSPKERHVSESEQPSCQISAVWYRRGPGAAPSSPNVQDLDSASENQATALERQHSKETSRPRLERMDTSSSFCYGCLKAIHVLWNWDLRIENLNHRMGIVFQFWKERSLKQINRANKILRGTRGIFNGRRLFKVLQTTAWSKVAFHWLQWILLD